MPLDLQLKLEREYETRVMLLRSHPLYESWNATSCVKWLWMWNLPPSSLSNLLEKRGNQEFIQADEDGGIIHLNMIIAYIGHIELILEEEEFDWSTIGTLTLGESVESWCRLWTVLRRGSWRPKIPLPGQFFLVIKYMSQMRGRDWSEAD